MPIPAGHPADKASRADKETENVILWMDINNYFYLVDSHILNKWSIEYLGICCSLKAL